MRAFIVISCLALASAAPQYSYSQPSLHGSNSGISSAVSSGSSNLNLGLQAPSQAYSAPSVSYVSAPSVSYAAPAPQAVYSAPAPQAVYSAPAQQAVYSAPAPQALYSAPAPQAVYSAPAAVPSAVQQQSYSGLVASPQQVYSAPQPQQQYSVAPQQYVAPQQQYSVSSLSGAQSSAVQQHHGVASALVQKHIYVHVPPPSEEEIVSTRNQPQIQAQKHYKIIFIKAPSAPSYAAQLHQQQQLSEEKTLVYVLVKKPEGPEDIQLPEIQPTQPSKPEVYFIKYKTQKEQHPVVIQNAPVSVPLAPSPILVSSGSGSSQLGLSGSSSGSSSSHLGLSTGNSGSSSSSSSSLSGSSSSQSLLSLGNSQASVASIIQPRQPAAAYGPPK